MAARLNVHIPKPINDRRRSVRVEAALPFRIEIGEGIETTTINVSRHGAMCILDRDLKMMSKVSIVLHLPSEKSPKGVTVRAKGVVVRKEIDPVSNKVFVAIFFSDISAKDDAALKDFIEASNL